MSDTFSRKVRRPYVHMSSYVLNQIHLRNPWVTVFWSLAFPGAGHMMLCKYFTGFMLMLWEFVINVNSNINLSIMYSMIGQFDKAKDVLEPRWFFLYMGVYLFGLWDCYRLTIDMNKIYLVAEREDATILPVKISALESNYLDIRKPLNGVIWSLITPGLGQIYFNRLPSGFYLLISFIVSVYQSHLGNSLLATMTGHFDIAQSVLNPEWLLFMPSIYGFAAYDAFVLIEELNILFEVEQSRFLSDNYRAPNFTMPKSNS
jgi:TM2 domain-containing membrane protein YozV